MAHRITISQYHDECQNFRSLCVAGNFLGGEGRKMFGPPKNKT